MTWFKIDDRMPDNAKIRKAGTAAVGLWALAGAWSAGNLTDGFVPKSIAKRWDSGGKLAKKLLDSGLWLEAERDGEKGFQFHQWDEWQPSRSDVIARRKATAERVAKHRANKETGDSSVSNASRNALQSEYVTPPPTRPDPTRSKEEKTSSAVLTLCEPPPAAQPTPLTPRPGKLHEPAGFVEFWVTYPRRQGKAAAVKAFAKALKSATAEEIIAGARRYAEDPNRDPTYTAHASTWLNHERWTDDPNPPRNGTHGSAAARSQAVRDMTAQLIEQQRQEMNR